MKRKVVFTPDALADLEAIFLFIAPDNPRRARSYVAEIQAQCRKLGDTPLMGVERSRIRAGLRILPLWRRVVVAYELPPDRVDILRVFSGRRDYEAIMTGDNPIARENLGE